MVRGSKQMQIISAVMALLCLVMLYIDKNTEHARAQDYGRATEDDEVVDENMVLKDNGRKTSHTSQSQSVAHTSEHTAAELVREADGEMSESTTSIDAELLATTPGTQRMNVLFLVSDDLRPQLNSYRGANYPNPGSTLRMHTPNLDKLADRSLQLNRAYVQFSVCNPSRASYMTSRRPDTTQVWDLTAYWRTAGGNFTTIPQYFKQQGYRVAGMGKIYHPGPAGGSGDVPYSWTERYFHERNGLFYQVINDSWWAVPEELSATKPLHDEGITTEGIRLLEEFAPAARTGEQPFFLAVGYQKPHIPFVFPERYLEHYPLRNMDLAPNQHVPTDFPRIHWFFVEGQNYMDYKAANVTSEFNETIPEQLALLTRRAYFSCVTFIDDMVGRIVDKLQELGLSDNTIVTFIGDHGFHLGENGMWGKHTNLEQATHAPMMIHIPGRTQPGSVSDALVEFTDLFPTIVDAAGVEPLAPCPPESNDVMTCGEGTSFMKLVDDPEDSVRQYALSQQSRGPKMGYTIRSDRFRYTEWITYRHEQETNKRCVRVLEWDNVAARELYDHTTDPGENHNVADKARYKEVVELMSDDLKGLVGANFTVRC